MNHPSAARRFLLPLTPLYRAALALAQALAGRGRHVNVLSRGYGRSSKAALRVDPDGEADQFGDEPLLIARASGVEVYVAQERYEAGLMAESALSDIAAPTIHLLDDGFQHRQLHRDLNILILDRCDLHDHLLPAGNLREPLNAVHRANVVVIPAEDPEIEVRLQHLKWHGKVWRMKRRMEVPAVAGPVVAFCGIARSDQFFAGLEASGLHLASRIAFADHHRYDQHDLDCILGAARSINATAFITTEKDRVRMGQHADAFAAAPPLKTAQLTIEIKDQDAAVNWLLGRLSSRPKRQI